MISTGITIDDGRSLPEIGPLPAFAIDDPQIREIGARDGEISGLEPQPRQPLGRRRHLETAAVGVGPRIELGPRVDREGEHRGRIVARVAFDLAEGGDGGPGGIEDGEGGPADVAGRRDETVGIEGGEIVVRPVGAAAAEVQVRANRRGGQREDEHGRGIAAVTAILSSGGLSWLSMTSRSRSPRGVWSGISRHSTGAMAATRSTAAEPSGSGSAPGPSSHTVTER